MDYQNYVTVVEELIESLFVHNPIEQIETYFHIRQTMVEILQHAKEGEEGFPTPERAQYYFRGISEVLKTIAGLEHNGCSEEQNLSLIKEYIAKLRSVSWTASDAY